MNFSKFIVEGIGTLFKKKKTINVAHRFKGQLLIKPDLMLNFFLNKKAKSICRLYFRKIIFLVISNKHFALLHVKFNSSLTFKDFRKV